VEQVTTRIYDPSQVQIIIGAPRDEHGNPVVIPGVENLFPVTINPGGVGSFVLSGVRAVEDGDRVTLAYGGQSVETELNAGAIASALVGFHYPLYCVDRGDRVDPESQYVGPFTTHDNALARTEDPGDLVRRCRQLRPSEIAFDREAANLAEFEVFSALVDELDEAACSGNLPEGAWHRIGERVVSEKFDDGTLPNAMNYDTWVDDHLHVDAYICEGTER
jgi:hypothetical protein